MARGSGSHPSGAQGKRRRRPTSGAPAREVASAPNWARPLLAHPIAAAAVLALVARLAHFLAFRRSILATTPLLDAELYDTWAREIAAGDWLGKGIFYANPLYPYVLGIIYRVFGGSADAARLAQHGLGVGTVALVTLLAQHAFGRWAALAAGALAATYGSFLLYEDLFLTETLVVFLGAASLALCLRAEGQGRPLGYLGAGCVLGLGLLARPTPLPFAALAWLAAMNRRGALMAALGAVLAVAPVTLRNIAVGGAPVLITAHGGETFYVGNRAGADGSNLQPSFVRSGPSTEHEDYRREASRFLGREVDLVESSLYWQRRALADIADDPFRWLQLEAKKLDLLLHAYEKGDNIDLGTARTQVAVQGLPLPGYGLVLALGLFGALATRGRLGRPAALLALAALAYATGCLLIFVTARYRLPLLVPLLPFAGHGVASLAGALAASQRSPRRAAGAAALVSLLLLLVHRPVPAAHRDDPALVAINLGYLRERSGDLEGAVRSYRQAISRRPDISLAHFNLGVAERRRGNLAAAESALARAIALEPGYADAFDELAMAREQAKDLDSALSLYRRAIALDPGRSRYYRNLGRLHVLRGEPSEAARAWERALTLNPSDTTTAGRLARLRAAINP